MSAAAENTAPQDDRAAIFVDGGYFHRVHSRRRAARVCYDKLGEVMSGEGTRVRTSLYTCPPYVGSEPTEEQLRKQAGFDRFRHAAAHFERFRLCLGRLQRIETAGGFVERQKQVDMMLGVDLVQNAIGARNAVLFAADGDFVPAIQAFQAEGGTVELWYDPDLPVSSDLLEAVDDHVEINDEFFEAIAREPGAAARSKAWNSRPARKPIRSILELLGSSPLTIEPSKPIDQDEEEEWEDDEE